MPTRSTTIQPPCWLMARRSLVASAVCARALVQYLRDSGLPEERIDGLKFPAGLDIGALTPEEIALNILAEIVQLSRRGMANFSEVDQLAEPSQQPAIAIDLVCGMQVEITTARYTSHYREMIYFFCARSCQHALSRTPSST